jgi:adenylate cyclase
MGRPHTEGTAGSARITHRQRFWVSALLTAALAFGLAASIQTVAQTWRWYAPAALQYRAYDWGMTRFALRHGAQQELPVVVAVITEGTAGVLQGTPNFAPSVVPGPTLDFESSGRLFHARALDNLTRAGARVVAFDLVFDAGRPNVDPYFAAAIRRHGRVILGAADEGSLTGLRTQQLLLPNSLLHDAAAAIGIANLTTDAADRCVRDVQWTRLGIDPDTADDRWYPALGIAAAALYAGREPGDAAREIQERETFLGRSIAWHDRAARTSYLSYFGPQGQPAGPGSVIPFEDLIRYGADPRCDYVAAAVKGKIVLVGDSNPLSSDWHPTPVVVGGSGSQHRNIPGVEIHAHIAQTVLSGNYLRLAPWLPMLLLLLAVCTGGTLLGRWLSPAPYALIVGLTVAALWAGSVRLLETRAVFLEPASATIGLALVFLMETQRRRWVIRRLSPHFGTKLLNGLPQTEWPLLAGEVETITVLYTDLEGSTAIAERLSGRELSRLMREYFDVMLPVVERHGGTLDKLTGDGLLAYFGWPLRKPYAADRAVRCAVEIQSALEEWQRRPERSEAPRFRTRIGIHTGEVTIDRIGKGDRAQLAVTGDVMNLASRLEGMNKELGTTILISEATRDAACPIVPMSFRGDLAVRGREAPVRVYSVDP